MAVGDVGKAVVRICFGVRDDVRAVMRDKGIKTLEDRRQRRVVSFVTKAAANPRFSHWFVERPGEGMNLRRKRHIEETRSKTI